MLPEEGEGPEEVPEERWRLVVGMPGLPGPVLEEGSDIDIQEGKSHKETMSKNNECVFLS